MDDVVIGDYARPWNARSNSGSLAPGIPKESLWAYEDGGVNQIGCVYTVQGFEFDYVGVIFGPDLIFSPEAADWKGDKTQSYDTVVKRSGDRFARIVKNTYRVLLTRGMKAATSISWIRIPRTSFEVAWNTLGKQNELSECTHKIHRRTGF